MNPTAPAEVNLSEAIRTELKANPTLTAKPAIELLASKGITINASLFNTVKFWFNKNNGAKTTPKTRKVKAKATVTAQAPASQPVLTTASFDAVTAAVNDVRALAQKIGPDVLRKIAATI